MKPKPLTCDTAQLNRIIGARPGVIETIKRPSLEVSYWPAAIFANEDEAMLGKAGKPKAYKSWSGAMNAAHRVLRDMQDRAKAELVLRAMKESA